MRSLKECYEIAKKHHVYWGGVDGYAYFMCHAATTAYDCGELTPEERDALTEDAMYLVRSHNKSEISLKVAMGEPSDEEVKAYWDKYIDGMEIQDG